MEKWLRENVFISEAEKQLPKNIDLDQLIEDYRSSLMLYNYKQKIIESELDTNVSEPQLESYYQEHKSDFLLNESLIKGRIFSMPASTKRIDKFYRRWLRNDTTYVKEFLRENAQLDIDFSEEWKEVFEVLKILDHK